MPRTRTKPTSTSKKAAPYRPPTQPRRTARRKNAVAPSSLPTGHVEASHYPEVPEICWGFNTILAKRIVNGNVQYLASSRPTWVDVEPIVSGDKSPDQMLAESKQMMGMYPSGPPFIPPNNPLSISSNVYGGNAAMSLANMCTSNMNPAMLQHSQLPRFPFDPAVPQPYPIQSSQQHPPISPHGNRALELKENLSERTVVAEALPSSDAAGPTHDIPYLNSAQRLI
ncbi:hypothetical protein WR25_18664 [Diploscapter pachys]|uniref:Uncharacterized protein n=1 Tax=Diploscapter pachys TaxID=2018661 RepID=A0A2A2L861_9BILA|nr:hypothetical protein WR25_18664 [Diploscapter pachys]